MKKLCRILRLASLAVLSGGSIAIVFAAITLVKTAEASGIPAAQAAVTNAPVFVQFSHIAVVCAVLLIATELVDYFQTKPISRLKIICYISSLLCFTSTLIFAWVLVPAMERLRPLIQSNTSAHTNFLQLHDCSRLVFGGIILFASIALLLPALRDES
jgi:hypothetical protein